ncbi:MAG: hypothetical protein LBT40_14185 [Deltaproteobacteria bacterium]|nr:hypothetical protein [Deltaproteobacteria bacterium]
MPDQKAAADDGSRLTLLLGNKIRAEIEFKYFKTFQDADEIGRNGKGGEKQVGIADTERSKETEKNNAAKHLSVVLHRGDKVTKRKVHASSYREGKQQRISLTVTICGHDQVYVRLVEI